MKAETNRANCLRKLNSYKEAKDIYKLVIDRLQRFFGSNSAELVKVLVNLATLYAEQGKREKALDYIGDAKKIVAKKPVSILQKRVNAIANKIEAMPPELISTFDAGPLLNFREPEENLDLTAITDEQQTIRDIILGIKTNYETNKVRDFFDALKLFLIEVQNSSDISGVIKKTNPNYIKSIKPIENAEILLNYIGYQDKGEELVVSKGDPQLFKFTIRYLSQVN
eukprot:TRINITY_DN3309_c0_g1_i5.p1 TRINITY_DN3309_c0_g1~~TRINITY_DN3309_c0_g1_i5.p1  ORF type:complete len:225 (+),score=41.49 TRINITY_DN3309_c0_g1_i5:106-780(+)